jgi:hypothetical protein
VGLDELVVGGSACEDEVMSDPGFELANDLRAFVLSAPGTEFRLVWQACQGR